MYTDPSGNNPIGTLIGALREVYPSLTNEVLNRGFEVAPKEILKLAWESEAGELAKDMFWRPQNRWLSAAGLALPCVGGAIVGKGGKLLAEAGEDGLKFADGLLGVHFEKHSKEWGAITEIAYEKRAKQLLNSEIGGNIQGFTSKSGYKFRYNVKTNELATMKPDKTIETLFRPKKGQEYWIKQIEKYGGN